MTLGTLLLIILIVLLVGGGIGHTRGDIDFAWPGGLLGVVLVVILILVLLGRI